MRDAIRMANCELPIVNCQLSIDLCLPHSVQVAVLIHGDGLGVTYTDHGFGLALVGKVYTDATILGLYIYKGDVVVFGHGMSYAAYLYLDVAIVDTGYHGEMLLYTGVNGIDGELLHLLAAAYDGYLRVYNLLDYIATMLAFEKFYCHNVY